MSEREDREYLDCLYSYWNLPARSPRGRTSLTKTFLVSMVFAVCIALAGHMSLVALSGPQETSGQEEPAAPATSQANLGPAAPIAAQDEPDTSSASRYWLLRPMGPPECYGKWYPFAVVLKAAFNTEAG